MDELRRAGIAHRNLRGRGPSLLWAAGALGLLAWACDDAGSSPAGDAADAAGDSARGDAKEVGTDTAADATGADASADGSEVNDAAADGSTDSDGTPDPCAVGASASGATGSDGLSLDLCTASIALAGDAFEAGTSVTLSIVEAPLEPPFERAFISPVYQLQADAELAGTGTVRLVDTSDEGGYRYLAWYTTEGGQAWASFEACPEEDGLSSPLFFLGTFVLLRDVNVYPSGPTGLGDGTLQSMLGDGAPVDWTFENGYVIHEDGQDGSRSVQVLARRDVEGGLQQIDIRLSQSVEGDVAVLQIALLDTTDASGGWSYLEPVHGPLTGESTLEVGEGGGIAGSVTTTVYQGELTEELSFTLDVQPEKFSFPPEGSCFPEG